MTGMAVLLLVRPIVRHRDRFAQSDERGDGWRTAGQGSGRDGAGGLHHAKQWRLDHVWDIPELIGKFDITAINDYNDRMQTEAPT
jgi:hypothetical protein